MIRKNAAAKTTTNATPQIRLLDFQKDPDIRISINGETVPNVENLGTQQVESLLAFMVEDPLERELENAERDNIVYDGLGEHRILGKVKKKKKKKQPKTMYGEQG